MTIQYVQVVSWSETIRTCLVDELTRSAVFSIFTAIVSMISFCDSTSFPILSARCFWRVMTFDKLSNPWSCCFRIWVCSCRRCSIGVASSITFGTSSSLSSSNNLFFLEASKSLFRDDDAGEFWKRLSIWTFFDAKCSNCLDRLSHSETVIVLLLSSDWSFFSSESNSFWNCFSCILNRALILLYSINENDE